MKQGIPETKPAEGTGGRRGVVVRDLDLRPNGPGFKSQPRHQNNNKKLLKQKKQLNEKKNSKLGLN